MQFVSPYFPLRSIQHSEMIWVDSKELKTFCSKHRWILEMSACFFTLLANRLWVVLAAMCSKALTMLHKTPSRKLSNRETATVQRRDFTEVPCSLFTFLFNFHVDMWIQINAYYVEWSSHPFLRTRLPRSFSSRNTIPNLAFNQI